MKVFNVLLIIIFASIFTISGCSLRDNWRGYIYPDKDNLTIYTFIGEFHSLESCRDQALSELEKIHALNTGDFECGLNCKIDEFGMEVCEDTLQ